MSKEAMKQALGKIKSARDCHPNAVDTLLFEAEEILEGALAKQPAPVQQPLSRIESAAAKAVNYRTDYQKPLTDRLEQLAERYDSLKEEVQRLEVALVRQQEQQAQQEPVAEVKAKMTGGNVGIATVIHEIYSPMRHPLVPGDLLYACPVNQAPVGWMHSRTGLFYSLGVKPDESGLLDEPTDKALPIYTSPPAQRTWVGLTEAERKKIEKRHIFVEDAIRLTEAKLKEKNI